MEYLLHEFFLLWKKKFDRPSIFFMQYGFGGYEIPVVCSPAGSAATNLRVAILGHFEDLYIDFSTMEEQFLIYPFRFHRALMGFQFG